MRQAVVIMAVCQRPVLVDCALFNCLVYKTTDIERDIERLAAGESGAGERLIRSAAQRLEHMVRIFKRRFPRVSRWEQTDDVFQNAILRLHRALASVEPRDAQHFLRLACQAHSI